MPSTKRFRGVNVVLTTPLDADERIDESALRKQLRRVLTGGVHGVVVLGSAGEFAALRDEEKRRAISITVDEVAGRVPVIAGTGEPGTRRAVAMTQQAKDLGADAALVVPPFYFRCNSEATARHYRTVAVEGGLPVLLYNIPGLTKVDIPVEVVIELVGEPNIAGIKDSSGSLRNFRRLTTAIDSDEFTIVTGSDDFFFHTLIAGGDGCVSPGSNVVPDWFVGVWDAFQANKWSEAWGIQERIEAMHSGIGHGGFPAGIKGAMSVLGIGTPRLAAPSAAVTQEQLAAIEVSLKGLGIS